MYAIGDFARLGRVSVRMLRHYDEIDLLRPAHVDRATGYRWYEAPQLMRLGRIVAYRELGFGLDQIRELLVADVAAQRTLLTDRREQVLAERQLADTRVRLISERLHQLDQEHTIMKPERKHVASQRYAVKHTTAAGFDNGEISRVLPPLYPALLDDLTQAGVDIIGPSIAYYRDAPDGDGIVVTAGFPIAAGTNTAGLEYTDLPACEVLAAVHHGSPSTFDQTYGLLVEAMSDQALSSIGYSREVYLECPPDMTAWVTELQFLLV